MRTPFPNLSVAFVLAAALCAFCGNSAIAQTAAIPPDATEVNGIAIPPDPGPENDQTLAGIDTTGTGVRDDVYRALAAHFGGYGDAIWAAALQDAQATQMSVLANGDPALSNAANDAEMAAGGCEGSVLSGESAYAHSDLLHMGDIIAGLTADTPDRLAAFERTESVATPDEPVPASGYRGYCKQVAQP